MKRGLLFSAAILMIAASAMAQTDVTPKRYVFADQPVGIWNYDAAMTGHNAGLQAAIDEFHDGYVYINNGQFGAGLTGAPNAIAVQSGTSIVDLGGEVGKILCIKGQNSTFPYGTAATAAYGPGWWNMSLYMDPSSVGVEQPVRFSIVFKIIQNIPDDSKFLSFDAYTHSGNNVVGQTTDNRPTFRGYDFVARWPEGDIKEDEEGYPMNDEDLWKKCEIDYQASDEAGVPLHFFLAFQNQTANFNNSTVLIKSITMVKNPVGEPAVNEDVKLTWDPTSVGIADIQAKNNNTVQYVCDGNNVTFKGLIIGQKVDVYLVNGQKVSSFVATESNNTITLNEGFYIVKTDSGVIKVVVK